MKKTLLTLAIIAIVQFSYAQFNTSSGNTTTSDKVGIGTANPSTALQIGDFSGGSASNQLLIPGTYNFEQVRLGQIGNGNSALEFINHTGVLTSYGIKFLVDVDHGAPGLQLQYASPSTTYNSLSYHTGWYMNLSGNVGIGTTSPAYSLDINRSGASLNLDGISGGFGSSGAKINFLGFAASDNNWQIGVANLGPGGLNFTPSTTAGGSIFTTPAMTITGGGNIGIGLTMPDTKLAVNGTIHTKEVKVDLTGWPDYVFKPKYNLPSLTKVKTYIDKNQHLPEMPSEQQVVKEGINLGEMNKLLTKKVEELTLYLIEEHQQNKKQQEQINELKSQIAKLIK